MADEQRVCVFSLVRGRPVEVASEGCLYPRTVLEELLHVPDQAVLLYCPAQPEG
jgi:hypothetical protein